MAKKMGKMGSAKNPGNERNKPNPPMRPGVGTDMAKAMLKGRGKKK